MIYEQVLGKSNFIEREQNESLAIIRQKRLLIARRQVLSSTLKTYIKSIKDETSTLAIELFLIISTSVGVNLYTGMFMKKIRENTTQI